MFSFIISISVESKIQRVCMFSFIISISIESKIQRVCMFSFIILTVSNLNYIEYIFLHLSFLSVLNQNTKIIYFFIYYFTSIKFNLHKRCHMYNNWIWNIHTCNWRGGNFSLELFVRITFPFSYKLVVFKFFINRFIYIKGNLVYYH